VRRDRLTDTRTDITKQINNTRVAILPGAQVKSGAVVIDRFVLATGILCFQHFLPERDYVTHWQQRCRRLFM